jgi:hypothetical protein
MKLLNNLFSILVLSLCVGSLSIGVADSGVGMDPHPSADLCPDQVFLPIPETVDANRIVIDPESGQRLYLGTVEAVADRLFALKGRACDPDVEDTVIAWIEKGTIGSELRIPLDPNGFYELPLTYPAGTYYLTIGATDISTSIGDPTAKSVRMGTWVIHARANRPPILCGGQP